MGDTSISGDTFILNILDRERGFRGELFAPGHEGDAVKVTEKDDSPMWWLRHSWVASSSSYTGSASDSRAMEENSTF